MSVYREAKKIFDNICNFLDKNNYSYETDEDGTIKVFNSKSTVEYHSWDLYLIDHCARSMGSKLDFSFKTETDGSKRFSISTEAVYDLRSYISRTNKTLQMNKNPDLLCVFVGENMDKASHRELSISTLKYDGTWIRSEYNRSEILFCAVKNYIPVLQSDGSYRYDELTELYDSFKDKK